MLGPAQVTAGILPLRRSVHPDTQVTRESRHPLLLTHRQHEPGAAPPLPRSCHGLPRPYAHHVLRYLAALVRAGGFAWAAARWTWFGDRGQRTNRQSSREIESLASRVGLAMTEYLEIPSSPK